MVDTEAKISVIKANSLPSTFKVNTDEKISIRGITDGRIYTLGTTKIDLKFNNIIFEHKFNVVDNTFDIPTDGIIGKDFLKLHGFCIDYNQMKLYTTVDNITIETTIKSEIEPFKTLIPSNSEVFRIFQINSNIFPCIILAQNLNENILIPTTIAHKRETWIRVANISDKTQKIDTNSIKIEPIENYDIFSTKSKTENDKFNKKRINELKNALIQNFPEHISNKLLPLCLEFADVFHTSTDKATVNNFYNTTLNLKDDGTVYVKNYRLPHSQKSEINKQVNKLLEDDLIEYSKSNYNSPLIIVPKKSNNNEKKWRMCVDYRLLNKKLIPDKFPLARIDEIHDSLGRAKFFSIMDLHAGYHQIPLDENSKPLTAFSTDAGFFQWKVLPFGINIAPASFSRMMTLAFSRLSPERILIYMDDLIVMGYTEEKHLENLRMVFETCRKYNLKLNPVKCQFFRTEVTFLGHKCTTNGLLPDESKIMAVKKYPIPNDKDSAKRFIAFVNYYRRFIQNFAELARPITHLTKKRVDFVWTDECQTCFEKLKNAILSPQILKYPDFDKKFKVTVDASQYACGGVLTQEHDDIDHPITFISKTFKKGEINKSTIEKELLAIHFAITTFRPYLYGKHFTVLSDHKPLIYLYKLKNPASKLTRIRLELEEYDFDVQHISGKDNVIADALSRISIGEIKEIIQKEEKILVTTRSMTKRQQMTKNIQDNTTIQTKVNKVVEELTTTFDKNIPRLKTTEILIDKSNGKIKSIEISAFEKHKKLFKITIESEKLTLKLILSKIEEKAREYNKNKLQLPTKDKIFDMCTINEMKEAGEKYLKHAQILLVPTPEIINDNKRKMEILEKFHYDPIFGGHYGQKKLYARVRERYYWKNMSHDISKFVRNCKICEKTKVIRKTREPLTITKTPQRPFDCVQIDTVGKLKRTINDNEYAVTIVCELTKYLVAINKSAREIAKAIVHKFILVYGPMKEIRTDLGTEYRNELIEEICKLLNIEQKFSTAYHHETVGAVERSHRTLNEFLRAYLEKNINEWDIYLDYFQFCYNTSKHESNGNKYSPYELIFGKQPILAFDILNGNIDPVYNIENYAREMKYRLQKAHNETVEIIKKMKLKNKYYYDRNLNPLNIKIGDLVFLEKEPYDKHSSIRTGPFSVININEPNVTIMKNNQKYEVHKNRLTKTNKK